MRLADENSWISLSYLGAIFAFLLYPLFLAPLGPATNGGALGLIVILLAAGFTWTAFALNRSHPKARMAIQLPMTALITFMAIKEAVTQYQLGPDNWLRF
jgi:predicted membrane-bound spermidine synthase